MPSKANPKYFEFNWGVSSELILHVSLTQGVKARRSKVALGALSKIEYTTKFNYDGKRTKGAIKLYTSQTLKVPFALDPTKLSKHCCAPLLWSNVPETTNDVKQTGTWERKGWGVFDYGYRVDHTCVGVLWDFRTCIYVMRTFSPQGL
jgi:hypothetical protein